MLIIQITNTNPEFYLVGVLQKFQISCNSNSAYLVWHFLYILTLLKKKKKYFAWRIVTFRIVGECQETDTGSSCPRSKNSDSLRVSSERSNILFNPT